MKKVFLVDGETYNSLEDVPEEKRSLLEELSEGTDEGSIDGMNKEIIKINGKTCHSIEDVPENYRSAIRTSVEEGLKNAAVFHRGPLKWIVLLFTVLSGAIILISLFLTRRIG
ncbi:MAG: hypothetical protein V1905_03840 [bacterium]